MTIPSPSSIVEWSSLEGAKETDRRVRNTVVEVVAALSSLGFRKQGLPNLEVLRVFVIVRTLLNLYIGLDFQHEHRRGFAHEFKAVL